MGTPLTGSSVASTYTGLLKNSDNSTVGASLKAISDGSGNDSALQVSNAAVNTTGDFSVATNKLTVASASGNTAVAGTLAVTGATNLSSLITSGAATIGGALNVTGATTLTGNLTVPGNLAVTGTSTLTGATAVTGTLGVAGASTLASVGVTGAATVGTTLGVTGVSTLTSAVVTGAVTVGTTLGVTGATTLAGDLAANGNTTLGNAGTDTLILNSDNITAPNISTVTVDLASDKVLITDASDSSKVKVVTASSFGQIAKCVQTVDTTRQVYGGSATAPGQEITVLSTTITPTSASSRILVTIVINYSAIVNGSQFILFRLTRGSTELGTSTGANTKGISSGSYEDDDLPTISNKTIQFLDSPNTTSATTYKLFNYGPTSQQNLYLNYAVNDLTVSTSSSMTLQEYL
jgi:hypothetical protein